MKKTYFYLLSACLLITTTCSKKVNQSSQPETAARTLTPPPSTWQEHWFEHNQLLQLKFNDSSVAVYFDNDGNSSITWPNPYLSHERNYTKAAYASFGSAWWLMP